MQLLAKFKKILYMGFRATLNFRKFKVALLVSRLLNELFIFVLKLFKDAEHLIVFGI